MSDTAPPAAPGGAFRPKGSTPPPGAEPPPVWSPPRGPFRTTLEGRLVRVEPLSAERHADGFFAALSADPEADRRAWTYRFASGYPTRDALFEWMAEAELDHGMRHGVYVDRESGEARGMGAFMTIAPAAGSIEIGAIMLAPAMQRTAAATEALFLQIDHAFALGYRRVEWTCDPLNEASMRAAERLGFTWEACFRSAYVTKGRNRDKAVFGIADGDWPSIRAAMLAWLDPANFDAQGRQRRSLSEMTAPLPRARAPASCRTASRTNEDGLPVGLPLPDWTPPRAPTRRTIAGRRVRLEPLTVDHAPALHAANSESSDGAIWRWLPYGPFETESVYADWVGSVTLGPDPLFFAIVAGERPLGVASFLRIAPQAGSIEIGHICLSPRLQRTPEATEALTLMIAHAFEAGYRRLEWKCDAKNDPSRAAAQRLGLSFEGITRQATVVKGRNRDTAWYAATDAEWPALRAAYDAWLDPGNFDPEGRQRRSLSGLTRPSLVTTG